MKTCAWCPAGVWGLRLLIGGWAARVEGGINGAGCGCRWLVEGFLPLLLDLVRSETTIPGRTIEEVVDEGTALEA